MNRAIAAILLAVSLTACTTSQQADKLLASKYQGTKADAFFVKYGPPASSYKLGSGETLYTWEERARYWRSSGSANTQVIGNTAFTTVTPGKTNLQQCQLKLVVSSAGLIENIGVLNDSLGVWQLSRCNEYFSGR